MSRLNRAEEWNPPSDRMMPSSSAIFLSVIRFSSLFFRKNSPKFVALADMAFILLFILVWADNRIGEDNAALLKRSAS